MLLDPGRGEKETMLLRLSPQVVELGLKSDTVATFMKERYLCKFSLLEFFKKQCSS